MQNKIVPIKYTSRDYQTIRRDLIEHAKRYYPDSFKDFNEGSFGSLMLDTVSYVGDILSFYLDYQANECFLETASEFNNVLKIARQLGYKHINGSTSTGIVSLYISVPATTIGKSPDLRYAPILRAGSTFSTVDGTRFILTQDVRFDLASNMTVPLQIGENGDILTYGIKAYGVVVSGITTTEQITIGAYEKYLKLKLREQNIAEILSVTDSEGNEYYEVQHLSQNIIYKSVTNKDPLTANLAKEILKPYMVPRRFTMETEIGATYLQFGASSGVEIPQNNSYLTEPGAVVLDMFGKNYISDTSFDPSKILTSDKMGISPSNTRLTVTYRYTPAGSNINFASRSLVNILTADLVFLNQERLLPSAMQGVRASLEVENETPIIGQVTSINSEELKIQIQNTYSSQNRAVTIDDYKAMVYSMPFKFGSIKRVSVERDDDSSKRNLNLYVLCEDENGKLIKGNQVVKNNLKRWIFKSKMLNDSIDILDGKIINYGINFTITAKNSSKPKTDVLNEALNQLKKDFALLPDFGETFIVDNIISSLMKVEDVLDVEMIEIVPKNGNPYSNTNFNIEKNMSKDKKRIKIPKNAIMEIKYPDSDIKGEIR